MMKSNIRMVTIALALAGTLSGMQAIADTTVVIVRHGEKPAQGLGQLSCQGLNRALALPAVLLSRYGEPTAIYAPNPAIKKTDKGISYAYIRPLATIEPLAIRAQLPVNIEWGMSDTASLANYLATQTSGTYVVAWEHHLGEKLAKELLAAWGSSVAVPDWNDADFDSIYVVRLKTEPSGERKVTFAREQEGLNGQPEACAK